MIVQPTPTNPPTRRLRARRVAGLIAAPVLLSVAVIAGFAGPRPEPPPRAAVAAPLASDALPASSPARVGNGAPASNGPAADSIPAMFGDLEAIPPSADLDSDAALSPDDAVAVAGWLAVDSDSQCIDGRPGAPYGPWCDRRGILAVSSWPVPTTAPLPQHLRVHFAIGVRLPSAIEAAGAGDELHPIPVLVVGRRSVTPAACASTGPEICDDELEVDRVAWADGTRMGLTPLIDDRLNTMLRPNPFTTALDSADLPLLAVLVWPEDVWRMDTDAGAVAAAGTPSQPVWYVRAIDGARGPGMDRHVRWMLLAEPDLRVLASGRPGVETAAKTNRG